MGFLSKLLSAGEGKALKKYEQLVEKLMLLNQRMKAKLMMS